MTRSHDSGEGAVEGLFSREAEIVERRADDILTDFHELFHYRNTGPGPMEAVRPFLVRRGDFRAVRLREMLLVPQNFFGYLIRA